MQDILQDWKQHFTSTIGRITEAEHDDGLKSFLRMSVSSHIIVYSVTKSHTLFMCSKRQKHTQKMARTFCIVIKKKYNPYPQRVSWIFKFLRVLFTYYSQNTYIYTPWSVEKILGTFCSQVSFVHDRNWWLTSLFLPWSTGFSILFSPPFLLRRGSGRAAGWATGRRPRLTP